jgi:hypothetical protein
MFLANLTYEEKPPLDQVQNACQNRRKFLQCCNGSKIHRRARLLPSLRRNGSAGADFPGRGCALPLAWLRKPVGLRLVAFVKSLLGKGGKAVKRTS